MIAFETRKIIAGTPPASTNPRVRTWAQHVEIVRLKTSLEFVNHGVGKGKRAGSSTSWGPGMIPKQMIFSFGIVVWDGGCN